MLEAVGRRKARMERLTGGGGREPREDMVTSALFGPLMMLRRSGRGLGAMLGIGRLEAAEVIDIALWPRFGADRAEPDVVLNVRFPNSDRPSLRVLVEVKWGAPLGPAQIERYVELMNKQGQSPGFVVLLGYEPQHERILFEEEASTGLDVVRRSWRDVARAMKQLSGSEGAVAIWASQVRRFLQQTEKGHLFAGLKSLSIREPQPAHFTYRAAGGSPWFMDAVSPGSAPYVFSRKFK